MRIKLAAVVLSKVLITFASILGHLRGNVLETKTFLSGSISTKPLLYQIPNLGL
jgi:hypothetical protein